jgi:hypothetical protein
VIWGSEEMFVWHWGAWSDCGGWIDADGVRAVAARWVRTEVRLDVG